MVGDLIGVFTYFSGWLLWFAAWHFLHGYRLMRRYKLLWIPFLGAQFVLLANMILAFYSNIPPHSVELDIYKYVEENAKTVASLALAIAIFIVMRMRGHDKISGDSYEFLRLILWSLIFSIVGVLPLYWMPAKMGWLTALRHFKSVPFFYSLFSLVAASIVFVQSMQKKIL